MLPRIARAQLDAGAVGICAAKLSEAEALVAAGWSRCSSPAGGHGEEVDRLAELVSRGHRIALALDQR